MIFCFFKQGSREVTRFSQGHTANKRENRVSEHRFHSGIHAFPALPGSISLRVPQCQASSLGLGKLASQNSGPSYLNLTPFSSDHRLFPWGSGGTPHLPCTMSVKAFSLCWGGDKSLGQQKLRSDRSGETKARGVEASGELRLRGGRGPGTLLALGAGRRGLGGQGVCEAGERALTAPGARVPFSALRAAAEGPASAGDSVKSYEARGRSPECESYSP